MNYLKQNKKAEYTILVMNNELQKHLINIDKYSEERLYDVASIKLTDLIEQRRMILNSKRL